MLLVAKLPKSFWGEVVSNLTYLTNKCPSIRIGFNTLIEDQGGKAAADMAKDHLCGSVNLENDINMS